MEEYLRQTCLKLSLAAEGRDRRRAMAYAVLLIIRRCGRRYDGSAASLIYKAFRSFSWESRNAENRMV
jgi:hypothetical protein